MEIIIKILLIVIFVGLCCFCISQGIDKNLEKELNRQKELNKKIIGLFQNEQDKSDTLWKIILHIREELSLIKREDCPKEEIKNIPLEIVGWIDLLEKGATGVQDEELKKTNKNKE